MDSAWSREQDWFWEGNIQKRVLDYMQNEEGFAILSSGQPVVVEQGLEIVAERQIGDITVHRLVNVRGWPSQVYTRGTMAGQTRTTRPEVIARGWIAQAMFDLALNRGADPDQELALALPTIAGYVRYLQRLRWFLSTARVFVYLISQDGRVSTVVPGAPPVSAFTQPAEPTTGGKRRKLGLPGGTKIQLPLLHVLVMSGGSATRSDCIAKVAEWFPGVPQPPPPEFSQRVSIAQNSLQLEGLTEQVSRGTWQITEAGRAAHDAEWKKWVEKNYGGNSGRQ
jgi:hypothetical protein